MAHDKKKTLDFCRNCLLISDVVAFLLAYLFGGLLFLFIRKETLSQMGLVFTGLFAEWSIFYLLIIPFAVIKFWYDGHYTRRKPFWDELKSILQVLFILFTAEGAILFLTKSSFSRLWVASSFMFAPVLLSVMRTQVKRFLDAFGKWKIPTVVVGTGPNAVDAVTTLHGESLLGFSVEHAFSLENDCTNENQVLKINNHEIPVHCLGEDPVAAIRRLGEPHIIFALETGGIRSNIDLLETLHRNFNDIYVVPALRGLPLYGMEVNTFFRCEVLMLRVRNILSRRMPRLLKRSFDIIGSLILLCLLSPLLITLAWRIRQDGGNVLFAHKRIGLHGREFNCFKFRSMIVDADKVLKELLQKCPEKRHEWETDFKLKDDPRVTDVGAFLRRYSLDELPQLINVLRGEMSLVGPRPIVDEEMSRYGNDIHYYKSVRPGMTGLWQISGRSDIDYSNRVYLDTWYVKNWSLWSDIIILFNTIKVVVNKKGAY